MEDSVVSASDWTKGIALSVAASIVGGASKLAIRKSWLLEHEHYHSHSQPDGSLDHRHDDDGDVDNLDSSTSSTRHLQTLGFALSPTESMLPATSAAANDRHDALSSSSSLVLGGGGDAKLRHRDSTAPMSLSSSPTSSSPQTPLFIRHHHHQATDNNINTKSSEGEMLKPTLWWPWTLRCAGMFGMTVLNPLCCVVAMNYASPSILAPFSGLTLVWIVLLSQLLIGEQPAVRQICAAALIVTGEVVVAVFGDHTNDDGRTVEDVRQSYREVFFLTFIALATLWILALARIILYSPSDACRRFAWGVSGGSVTGFQNFLKDALTVFKASAQNKSNVDTTPQQPRPYGLLALLVGLSAATAFGGLLLLTSCMKRYDATYSSAMFVGSFVIMASVMSVVHYDTLNHLDGVINLVLYPIGLCILMLGVYILTGTNATVDSSGDVGRHSPSQMPLIVDDPILCHDEINVNASKFRPLSLHPGTSGSIKPTETGFI